MSQLLNIFREMGHKNVNGCIKIYEISASYGVVFSVSTRRFMAQEHTILLFIVYSIIMI